MHAEYQFNNTIHKWILEMKKGGRIDTKYAPI